MPPEVDELVRFLRTLIRFNTTNPPGEEIAAARFIEKVFKSEGIETLILSPAPGRANVVARLKGNGAKKPLLLMSHLDVVDTEGQNWSFPPFSAELNGGCIWGRGALDCKNSTALWMSLMLRLKRDSLPLNRDIIFLATADEERGHRLGIEWLCENHFSLIDSEAALNEGGGFSFLFGDKTFFTYQPAEKGNLWLSLTARGPGGHASSPWGSNPLTGSAELAVKLSRLPVKARVTPAVKEMLRIMGRELPFPYGPALSLVSALPLSKALLSRLIPDQDFAASLYAMTHSTLTPTVLKRGTATNIIPDSSLLEMDIRLLPGEDPTETEKRIRKICGNSFTVKVLDKRLPNGSPLKDPLINCLREAISMEHPGAVTLPLLLPGGTDANCLRPKRVKVYGFTPLLPEDNITLAHKADERISLKSLDFGYRVGLEVLRQYAVKGGIRNEQQQGFP